MKYFHNPAVRNIPPGWQSVPIKYSCYVKGRIGWHGLSSDDYATEGCYLVTGTDLVDGRVKWDTCHRVSEEIYERDPYIQLREGDVLVTKDGTIGKIGVVERMPGPSTLNSGLFVVRPEGTLRFHPRFMYHVLNSGVLKDFIAYQAAGSTISHLYQDTFVNMPFLLPPISEQRAIADFLDRETARIDSLMASKKHFLALLDERTTALIRLATRRGLEAAPLRAVDVPWIIEIPAHWTLRSMKRIGAIQAGAAFPDTEQGRVGEEIPYFKVSDFDALGNEEELRYSAHSVSRETARRLRSPLIPANSVVFPKIGAALLTNRRRILTSDSCLDQNVMALTVTEGSPRYFFYLLMTLDFGRLRMPGPVPLLNEQDASNLLIPVPPGAEQAQIASHLDRNLAPLRELQHHVGVTLGKLQERRQALIASAVTGQMEITFAA